MTQKQEIITLILYLIVSTLLTGLILFKLGGTIALILLALILPEAVVAFLLGIMLLMLCNLIGLVTGIHFFNKLLGIPKNEK